MASRTGVGCRVLIDGAELDDGCFDWNAPPDPAVPEGVFASEGLNVVWGRATTIDQPESSTCSFTVIDGPGGSTVLDALRLGARVDVLADAVITGLPDDGSNAFMDPGFDTEVRGTAKNGTLERSQRRAEIADGWSAVLYPKNLSALSSAILAPGPIQPEGTNPASWAGLQSTHGGETWTIRARLYLPRSASVTVRPVLYAGPWESAAQVLTQYGVTVSSASGGWKTAEFTFAPGTAANWVGVQIETSGGLPWTGVATSATWANTPTDVLWIDYSAVYLDQLDVLGPASGAAQTVMVFSGRITDLEGSYDPGWDLPRLNVTASDFLADMGNRYIGAEPFPLEDLAARVTRILSLAAIPGESPVTVDIAPAYATVPISWDDVDHAAAAGLLVDLAQSVDGVLWSATHPVIGPYIRLEDPAQRLALYQLALVGGKIVVQQIAFADAEDAPPALSACDVLRDPVSFTMDVSDIATRTSVTWESQLPGPEFGTEEMRVEVIDPTLEQRFGTRAVSVQSQLTTQTDAQNVAERLIARLGASWRFGGIAVTDADVTTPDATTAQMFLLLLNGVTRGGQPLLITDLPSWSPTGPEAPVYIEGGSYTFRGGWDLEITVSRAAGVGRNAEWDQLTNAAEWTWDAWDPGLTWDQLRGVAGPGIAASKPAEG